MRPWLNWTKRKRSSLSAPVKMHARSRSSRRSSVQPVLILPLTWSWNLQLHRSIPLLNSHARHPAHRRLFRPARFLIRGPKSLTESGCLRIRKKGPRDEPRTFRMKRRSGNQAGIRFATAERSSSSSWIVASILPWLKLSTGTPSTTSQVPLLTVRIGMEAMMPAAMP